MKEVKSAYARAQAELQNTAKYQLAKT